MLTSRFIVIYIEHIIIKKLKNTVIRITNVKHSKQFVVCKSGHLCPDVNNIEYKIKTQKYSFVFYKNNV